MPLTVASRQKSRATLERAFPGALFLDVTSKGPQPWVRFSPFYPHGNIPVPLSAGVVAASVEGVWQALKVFEHEGVDRSKLSIRTMKGLKRGPSQARGRVLGHQAGLSAAHLLPYVAARRQIYLPTYRWVLEHRLADVLDQLRRLAEGRMVVLLDYQTNGDVEDVSSPLSHAALIKRYLEDDWPAPAA